MRRALGVTAAAVLWMACGGSGSSNNGGGGGGGSTLTASVNGQAFSGDSGASLATAHVQNGVSFYAITAAHVVGTSTATATGITLTLYNIAATGTYPLGVGSTNFGGVGAFFEGGGSSIWQTPLNGTAGTVTLTSLTPSRIAGTFSFTALALASASGTRTVTSGSFDMAVTGTPGTVQPYQGSTMNATLGGTAWVGATIAVSKGSGSYNVLGVQLPTPTSISGSSVEIILNGVTGPGTYALTGANVLAVLLPAGSFSSTANGATGSVIVTSLDANRMKGTFSATLPGVAGGGSLAVSGGAFDLGLGK